MELHDQVILQKKRNVWRVLVWYNYTCITQYVKATQHHIWYSSWFTHNRILYIRVLIPTLHSRAIISYNNIIHTSNQIHRLVWRSTEEHLFLLLVFFFLVHNHVDFLKQVYQLYTRVCFSSSLKWRHDWNYKYMELPSASYATVVIFSIYSL